MLALLLAPFALADDAKLDSKVEAALVETIELTSAGEHDAWMDKYCEPRRCSDTAQRSEWKAYQLKQAQAKAKLCMSADKKITVSQRRGEIASGEEVVWFIKCEGRQMPAGMRFRYDAEKDRVYFSHLGF